MGGVQDPAANLEAAIAGEGHEFKSLCPGFIREAAAEGNRPALISCKNANVVEEVHSNLCGRALAAVRAGRDLPAEGIGGWEIRGNTVVGARPDQCSVCRAG